MTGANRVLPAIDFMPRATYQRLPLCVIRLTEDFSGRLFAHSSTLLDTVVRHPSFIIIIFGIRKAAVAY